MIPGRNNIDFEQLGTLLKQDGFRGFMKQTMPGLKDHEYLFMKLYFTETTINELGLSDFSFMIERMVELKPDDPDLWDILVYVYEKKGDNRAMISANEMYAWAKNLDIVAEQLATVSDREPRFGPCYVAGTSFSLKCLLDKYRSVPVLLAMESHNLGSHYGTVRMIAKDLAKELPGRFQPIEVDVDGAYRVKNYFKVDINVRQRLHGGAVVLGGPFIWLLVDKGRVVIDWRLEGFDTKDLKEKIAQYLDSRKPLVDQPLEVETRDFFTGNVDVPVSAFISNRNMTRGGDI